MDLKKDSRKNIEANNQEGQADSSASAALAVEVLVFYFGVLERGSQKLEVQQMQSMSTRRAIHVLFAFLTL